MKRRTQILLDDWQYESVREMARRMKTTLSSLIRTWVTEKLRHRGKAGHKDLLRFAGKIHDKPDVGRSHDRYLSEV